MHDNEHSCFKSLPNARRSPLWQRHRPRGPRLNDFDVDKALLHMAELQISVMHLARFWGMALFRRSASEDASIFPAQHLRHPLASPFCKFYHTKSCSQLGATAAHNRRHLRSRWALATCLLLLLCTSCCFMLFSSPAVINIRLPSRMPRIPACQPPSAPPCSHSPLPPPSLEGHPHRHLAPGSVRTPALRRPSVNHLYPILRSQ